MNNQHTSKFLVLLTAITVMGCSSKHTSPPADEGHQLPYHKDIVDRQPITRSALKAAMQAGTPEELAKSGLWFAYDPELDGVQGVGSERAYSELNMNPKNPAVIVAVIDSGVDIEHEDLQGQIWVNQAEASGKPGVDDDKNGYVDDFHGWNYLGGYDKDGKPTHVTNETLEVTRIVKKLSDKKNSGAALSPEEVKLLEKTSKELEEERTSATEALAKFQKAYEDLKAPFEVIKSLVEGGLDELTIDKVNAVDSKDKEVAQAKEQILKIYASVNAKHTARVLRIIERSQESLNYSLNLDFNPRAEIVKDNPEDISDLNYGNNDVKGPTGDHGTHVSGIIAAVRNNKIGVNGIAENVKIMALRAVPNGDERDKDVALAVRYAVDNGARIINMSFGKGYSPEKHFVDDAMKYAASKGVLIVHAAGNENTNTDGAFRYPNRELNQADERGNNEVSTWIEVGASSAFKNDKLPAAFSNYGRRKVDVFAPGFEISSTVPDNKYAIFSGTSMASPSLAGVAALILSQRPELNGVELKDYVLSTARRYPGLKVILPGTKDVLVPFSELSRTGGVSDVLYALKNLVNIK